MEESGENWPSDCDMGSCVDVIFDDGDDLNEKDLSEKMLELSATIPDSNKIDNASILDKARNYVKQLQERVKELEKDAESKKNCSNNNGISTDSLPEVKAIVSKMEVLIKIHCEKQNGVLVKILTHIENLHLSVKSSSVLEFGKSTFGITIVAQMGDGYNITVDDLVKSLITAISTK
ncbi:transcription factor bHLH25-like [Vicia villosa]|uniref:transcription factor bHLH25-like n=1 Tax=Vicia villosa TaxID=3911 RepID=UPI00273C914B|nr:transcription factor bHLH25-like [Vicia villosa]